MRDSTPSDDRAAGGSAGATASSTAGRLVAIRDREPLPDVASGPPTAWSPRIDRVGMAGIQAMVSVADEQGQVLTVPAEVDADVSLDDPAARGIHMSRLYLSLQRSLEEQRLNFGLIETILRDFIRSHRGLSQQAALEVRYTLPLRRRALLSDNQGWRHYPVTLGGRLAEGVVEFRQSVEVTYSSTCPCSAALSRQVAQAAFDAAFDGRGAIPADELRAWLGSPGGMPATPHSQRSTAAVTVVPAGRDEAPTLVELIDRVEAALATPVQTAVKREDEQRFAERNGGNLMFCEDAARRVHGVLIGVPGVVDHRVRIDHRESLHAHDASAVIVRGVEGGLRA